VRMGRRPLRLRARVNWAVRWGGLAALMVSVCVYMVTAVWSVGVLHQDSGLGIGGGVWRGQVSIVIIRNNPFPVSSGGWWWRMVRPSDAAADSWTKSLQPRLRRYRSGAVDQREIAIPLWMAAAPAMPLCAMAWFAHSSKTPRACGSCRYDLSGLPPGSPCPECAAVSKA
jgi:hypothetical protein